MKLRFVSAVAIALVSAASNAPAQFPVPDFNGDWHSPDRSASPITIWQDAIQIKVTEHATSKIFRFDGSPTYYNADGTLAAVGSKPKTAPVRTTGKWIGDKLSLTVEVTEGDKPSTTVDVYSLSGDRKTLTRERTITLANGGSSPPTKVRSTYVK
ncbi:MAG TPA: hypothetical protein VFO94_13380 [Gammaproteobacteria bacterium]|nr:hypothetical protein [Gammaproteobacteria bacterium]